LGTPRLKVQDASALTLWQQLSDMEELPGARLSFTTSANTPDAIAFLAMQSFGDRMVFHAPCGRLHLWPELGEVPALVRALGRRVYHVLDARGTGLDMSGPEPVMAVRRALRTALDPAGTFALGPRWVDEKPLPR